MLARSLECYGPRAKRRQRDKWEEARNRWNDDDEEMNGLADCARWHSWFYIPLPLSRLDSWQVMCFPFFSPFLFFLPFFSADFCLGLVGFMATGVWQKVYGQRMTHKEWWHCSRIHAWRGHRNQPTLPKSQTSKSRGRVYRWWPDGWRVVNDEWKRLF